MGLLIDKCAHRAREKMPPSWRQWVLRYATLSNLRIVRIVACRPGTREGEQTYIYR